MQAVPQKVGWRNEKLGGGTGACILLAVLRNYNCIRSPTKIFLVPPWTPWGPSENKMSFRPFKFYRKFNVSKMTAILRHFDEVFLLE